MKHSTPYDIDPDLVAAIMWVESRGDPNAVSSSNAVGLLQIMPREAGYSRPSKAELLCPDLNIEWGVRILNDGLEYFNGDVTLALGEYYDGRRAAISRTPRAMGYAQKVLGFYRESKWE